jgi:hypothetical protein
MKRHKSGNTFWGKVLETVKILQNDPVFTFTRVCLFVCFFVCALNNCAIE